MKKTLVALTIAAFAATAANATVIYNQDSTKVELSGAVRVALGKFEDQHNKRTDLINDESKIILNAEHDLGNGLKALAGYELRFEGGESESDFGSPSTYQLYGGFAHDDVGTLTFGRQKTNWDDVQLSDFTYWGGNNEDNLHEEAEKSVKFRSAEWSGFSFGVDYLFGNANKIKDPTISNAKNESSLKYGYGASLFYTRDLIQDLTLNLAAGYEVSRMDDKKTTDTVKKNTAWRTSAQVVYGPASFGAEYGENVEKEHGSKKTTNRFLLVGAAYQVIEPSQVYLQWQRNSEKKEQQVDNKRVDNVYIVGADYKFTNNVVTFVEYARKNIKDFHGSKDKENTYGAGLRIFF